MGNPDMYYNRLKIARVMKWVGRVGLGLSLLTLGYLLHPQTIVMSPTMTIPLPPTTASALSTWTDAELYAYNLGVIEGGWRVAGELARNGDEANAWKALQAYSAYWWMLTRGKTATSPGGIRGAMAYIRALYKTHYKEWADKPLIAILLTPAKDLEQ